MTKFVFVTGGVLSSLGKGILTSSIAKLFKDAGVNASAMKIDPYLNCDAGTLNPFEHGEVFVTQDGFECDMDLGNYERFLDIYAKKEQNLMMGAVYRTILEKERAGAFLGKTLQAIPHVTDEIRKRVRKAAEVVGCDLLVVEIGGTVGDIESEIVLEAARLMKYESPGDVLFVHLAFLPTIITGEQKTKPIQHSAKALLQRGIVPDILVARGREILNSSAKEKIAVFCNVCKEDIFSSPDVESIYELPLVLSEQGLEKRISEKLGLYCGKTDFSSWRKLIEREKNFSRQIRVGVVAKYAISKDAYASIFEALHHAGMHHGIKVIGELVDSEKLEKDSSILCCFDAIIVPGGFGSRGTEGKIKAIKYARENNVPFLGICFGFQLAVVEYARSVLGLLDSNSTEINEFTKNPVIDLLPEQKNLSEKGGTMRLGVYSVELKEDSVAHRIYGLKTIQKRFRHRYEANPEYVEMLSEKGLFFSGRDPKRDIMKILELPSHKFFVGVQFHPEFDSRVGNPEPLFRELIKATLS